MAQAISADGSRIIGHGFLTGAWMVTIEADCPADTNGDSSVDVLDLVALITAWGTDDADADINNDGTVDVNDLVDLVVAWGSC